MEILLVLMDDPGFQSGVGDLAVTQVFDLQLTICRHVDYIMDHIVEKSGNWIKFPVSPLVSPEFISVQEINSAKQM